jgi:plastocyanin
MKLDIAKLPVAEAVIGFLVVMIIVAFVGAFSATSGSDEGEAVSASPTSGASPGASASPGGALAVTMHDNRFDPNEITVQAGAAATIQIKNDGKSPHNMHIAGPGGDYTEDFCAGTGDPCSNPNQVRAGQTATLTYQVPASAGEVDFRCDFHPQEMTGKITIQ